VSKKRFILLTDGQWELIEPLLPEPKRRKDNWERSWALNRGCLEGIPRVPQTGAAWRFPDKYPSPATCWRRLNQWEAEDVRLDTRRELLGALHDEGPLKWEESFLDASFAPAKKGTLRFVKPSAAKERSVSEPEPQLHFGSGTFLLQVPCGDRVLSLGLGIFAVTSKHLSSPRPWECGNPEGISKECRKGGKPASWLSMLSIFCHFHGLLSRYGSVLRRNGVK
jgi:transposase